MEILNSLVLGSSAGNLLQILLPSNLQFGVSQIGALVIYGGLKRKKREKADVEV